MNSNRRNKKKFLKNNKWYENHAPFQSNGNLQERDRKIRRLRKIEGERETSIEIPERVRENRGGREGTFKGLHSFQFIHSRDLMFTFKFYLIQSSLIYTYQFNFLYFHLV